MNYIETLAYLFAQLPMYQRIGASAYKADLENTLALDRYFGHPHTKFKTIHVAGTNGKGSVSHMLASILQESGFKVGLYTSPHLIDFRERVKINGTPITEDAVVEFVDLHHDILEKIKPSFFEMTVALAFHYFAQQQVDIAVVEVGMGGRLDSTNIITPVVSVITNISLDHTAFLGDTIEKIAYEKAGIIKPNVPVVIGEYLAETAPVFIKKAAESDAAICFSERRFSIRSINSESELHEMAIKNEQSGTTFNIGLDLKGVYQKKNIVTVYGALQILTPLLNLPKQAIISGFAHVIKNTKLWGRWQVLQNNPKVICDTGHNTAGIEMVMKQLSSEKHNKLHMLIGAVNDKDVSDWLKLLPIDAIYYFTQAEIPRALDSEVLAKKAADFNLKGKIYKSVASAYSDALAAAQPDDLIFVGGSTFVVGDLLKHLNFR